ncbi:FAD:protein FMN transferase [Synoicihabitans lomoniglobus]|uniref:FAD:protein FMN transferase n=1 Tax=Synoicihabitans lomoniglobus TaxID=2909285 RepID=A0AAF0CQ35_9BACT|nr:FAD:protein FMN transferase [Opitutaceae bacterium LMO-M01]WED65993.1 FAD:protein FMN transferase [Opitutaceae bacterium LMO-M01]
MNPAALVQLVELAGLESFEHEAMATRFSLYLAPTPEGERRAIAEEAFRLLDKMEDCLSFYREGSDVTRINRAVEGEVVRLDEWTHQCLLIALEVAAASDGAFDPFAGAAAVGAKSQAVPSHLADLPLPEPDEMEPVLAIDAEQPWITKLAGRRWLDLGAVGKGAAIDAMVAVLHEWQVPTAVLVGGGSSVLVYGSPPSGDATTWTLVLPQLPLRPRVSLTAPFALGASGEGFQPGHVIPGAGRTARSQALVLAPTAAWADALSTAALLLPDASIQSLGDGVADMSFLAVSAAGKTLRTGKFTELRFADPVVSLVIPCWCESERLPAFLHALGEALMNETFSIEVLVIDDGSPAPDAAKTARVVADAAARFPMIKPMGTVGQHRGKGGAIYHGWRHSAASVRWLALVDADGAVPAAEVVRGLREALATDSESILIAATRYHRDASRRVHRGWIRQRTGGWFARWAQRQLGLGAVDSQCGFKVVPAPWWRARDAWTEEGYAFDLELLVAARDDGIVVKNLPISWREIDGSNVSWRDGVQLVRHVRALKTKASSPQE